MPRGTPGSMGGKIGALLAVGALVACSPSFRVMERTLDTAFPGSRGQAERYLEDRTAWTRTEALGVRGQARVTMLDPSLGAELIAFHAAQAGREVSPTYDRSVWEALYGERGERLPFDVSWRFDRLFQPQRTANPQIGWTFTLMDDHGRRWEPLSIDDVTMGSDRDSWTGSFRVWFPSQDVVTGPLFDAQTRKVVLRVRGAPGQADFAWKFRPDVGAPDER